jgi:1,2-phenylacetyl-CoA epoxidase PaaB subunit
MSKKIVPKQELYSWDIFRLRGTPAAFVGSVEAPDEQAAVKKAIDEYQITNPEHRRRLVAQRRRSTSR